MSNPDLIELLKSQRQLLLLGSPGSGKSWTAAELAREVIAQTNFQLPYYALSPPDQDLLEHPSSGYIRSIPLHPAFHHEHFVEGYRHEIVQGQATAVLRDGAFKRLCRDAVARPQLGWCLILDDIHRTDAAALFGETLQLLSRRNQRIWLPASGDTLVLSPNVFIIATSQLTALPEIDPIWLRRFATVTLESDYTLLPKLKLVQASFSPGTWLENLNQRLSKHLGASAPGETLGPGYLFWESQPPLDFPTFQTRLHFQIWPRLQQLCARFNFEMSEVMGTLTPGDPNLATALAAEFPEAFS